MKDVLRLCFVSYDPNLYFNENAEVFNTQVISSNKRKSQKDLKELWDFTSNKEDFIKGNRNNFIHLYGCNANRRGFEMSDVISYAYNYSDNTLTKEEIDRTIKSAYENNLNEKGSFAKYAKSAKSSLSEIEKNSPLIPDEIYNNLPPILKEACFVFKGRERDVFFTSALSIISGGLDNVTGLYANDIVFPNLFIFIW